MTSHKFITEPKITFSKDGCFWTEGVQETNFSDGTTIIANFNKEPYSLNGKVIKGRDFSIKWRAIYEFNKNQTNIHKDTYI